MRTILPLLIFIFLTVVGCSQKNDGQTQYNEFWAKTENDFRNPKVSPLSATEIAEFDSVPRFQFDEKYRVVAKWELTPNERPFKIEETGERRSTYLKVAELHFEINDKPFKLAAYQNLELIKNKEFKNYIFVPFTDLTNGFETYGGGRYLDLEKPKGEELILDFNQTYNPYCAYNDSYSCPIPPRENHLEIEINAGAKYVSKYDG